MIPRFPCPGGPPIRGQAAPSLRKVGGEPAPTSRASPPWALAYFTACGLVGDEFDLPELACAAAYDFSLTHERWHEFEHICFLARSLAFWWCIIRPWPTRKQQNSWGLLLYLVRAETGPFTVITSHSQIHSMSRLFPIRFWER